MPNVDLDVVVLVDDAENGVGALVAIGGYPSLGLDFDCDCPKGVGAFNDMGGYPVEAALLVVFVGALTEPNEDEDWLDLASSGFGGVKLIFAKTNN